MASDPPEDPHMGKTPIDSPIVTEPEKYEYVEGVKRDVLYGDADFSAYSDAELNALRNELLVSAPEASRAIQAELTSRRHVDESPPDDAAERTSDSAANRTDPRRSDAESEADGYVDGYEAGYDDGYQSGYEE